MGLGADLHGKENFGPIGIRSPDRPGRSQSLYRLRHAINEKVQIYLRPFGLRQTVCVATASVRCCLFVGLQ